MRTSEILGVWLEHSQATPNAKLYALLDAAVDSRAIRLIEEEGLNNECLFGYSLDTDIARTTPRLVLLRPSDASPLLQWIERNGPKKPVATLLASPWPLGKLADHLKTCIDVELEGIDSMYLALWDPAILGTLVGQPDDTTLHVPGPVLGADQIAWLLSPLTGWWYWDRQGALHAIPPMVNGERQPMDKLVLSPKQVDALVEAAVPDHLLQHIAQNQPELAEKLPEASRYPFVRQQLARARAHGLGGMGDLVNYVCVSLAFGADFDLKANLPTLLSQVKTGQMRFDQALSQVDEAALEASRVEPELLP